MSLLVLGTVPVTDADLLSGEVGRDAGGRLTVGGAPVPSCQGSSAMLAAALAATEHLGVAPPRALLGGDVGRGDGTRRVYERLADEVERARPTVLAFHYLQPVMALMRRAVSDLAPWLEDGLALVADAGGMYAAKAAGLATRFELMTPDVGEVGFLAEESVTHPAYVSRFLFGTDAFDPVHLAGLAHATGGSARVLLIKGSVDHVAESGRIAARVDAPDVPALEAIGGTGDTITGLAATFMAAGFPTLDAAVCAAKANRSAGAAMRARPDHRAEDLVRHLPAALADGLCEWAGACVGR